MPAQSTRPLRPAFAAPTGAVRAGSAAVGASSLVCRRAARAPEGATAAPRWTMGKVSKFGPFSPVVILASFVLGSKRLNKIRGKAIALHSQTITAFCGFTGTGPQMRTALIKQAKQNGDTLGFLS
jgi:hypothetical protein